MDHIFLLIFKITMLFLLINLLLGISVDIREVKPTVQIPCVLPQPCAESALQSCCGAPP